MPDSRLPSHQPDGSTEDRFLHWVDHLVDPTTGAAPPPDPDFAGVAETAHTIHRAAGLGASIAPSPERADAIWESLMHTSTGGLHVRSITPVQPAAFNGSAPPPAKLRPSAIAPRPGWRSYLMATALFAAIVVASAVALWRITDPLDGRDSDVANQPGFIASSTPATEVQCDLTSDMPVFVGSVPDAPFLDTYLLLDDGVLTMNCDQASTTIASGVEQVKPAAWPGAIALVMQDGTGQLVNLSNGATVTLGSGELLDHSGQVTTAPTEFVTAPHSPWLVSIANGNRTDWRITDLRTMESLLLSDEIGGSLPEPRLPLISNGLSSQSDIANGSGVAVIAFMNGEYEAADTPDADVHAGSLPTPGAALVLPGTLDARRWIDLSPAEARIPMLSAGVSADTSLLAYVTTADTGDELIRIERTTSGEDVAEMPIDQAECPTFSNQVLLFVGNEPKLLYSDGCSIEILSWSPDIERMPLDLDLLSGDVRVYPTADPDIVLLEQGGGAMTIDVTNGTVIREFQYVPYLGNQLQFSDGHGYVGAMVTVTADGPNDLAVIQIVNPVTGKVLAASQTIGAHPIQLTQTYGVSLVRNGTLAILLLPPDSAMEVPPLPPAAVIVLDAYTREEWMIKLPPYDDWLLIASPDGRYLSYVPLRTVLDGEEQSFMMKSTGPGSGWVEVPAGSVPGFVIGTHDLPSSITDEPAVLEAQEITPIVASPAATPATPVAISNGCDLTQDLSLIHI